MLCAPAGRTADGRQSVERRRREGSLPSVAGGYVGLSRGPVTGGRRGVSVVGAEPLGGAERAADEVGVLTAPGAALGRGRGELSAALVAAWYLTVSASVAPLARCSGWRPEMWDDKKSALAERRARARQQQQRRQHLRAGLMTVMAAGEPGDAGRLAAAESGAASPQQTLSGRLGGPQPAAAAAPAGRAPAPRPPAATVWLLTWSVLVLICICASGAVASGTSLDLGNLLSDGDRHVGIRHRRSEDNITICPSIKIRHDMTNGPEWELLSSCDVIEGHLQLVLIGSHGKYPLTHFPKLKQVTHYIIFYRVQNMPSFSEMFPNLTVIRGYKLLGNYALIVYESQQLRDLGLIGLTRIMRGAVRIEKNPYLCYMDTIDWERLTGRKTDDVIIQDNGSGEECAGRVCMDSCANSTAVGRACWNQQHCQTLQFTNCHSFCEGGCTTATSARPSPRDCVACKNVVLKGECMESCPNGTFLYEGWRCISEQECMKMKYVFPRSTKRFKAHNGKCVFECPVGFASKIDNGQEVGVCEKCEGDCHKYCHGDVMINTLYEAQSFRGCTHINGSLRIQVSGENVVEELERSLKDVTEIFGYLRVSYSEPLLSMNFLPNLKVIHGKSLESRQYSLYFLQNANLQSLWSNTTNFEVKRGKAFFHFNHQLCLDKIYALLTHLNMSTEDNVHISPMTNGDQAACQEHIINATVVSCDADSVLLEWDDFRSYVADFRTLLGYTVYYREAPHRNLSIFTGRDGCGSNLWSVMDFPNAEVSVTTKETENDTANTNDLKVKNLLTKLEAFTQYAFYVETMMALTSPNTTTGRSEIVYFTTKEMTPTLPRNLKAQQAKSESDQRYESLLVTWDPPLSPNGIITEYVVRARYNDPETMPSDSNTCKSDGMPLELETVTTSKPVTTTTPKPRSCPCPSEGTAHEPGGLAIDGAKSVDQIHFENLLQNLIFTRQTKVKPPDANAGPVGRRRRSIDGKPLVNNITMAGNSVGVDETEENITTPGDPCLNRPHRGGWCMEYEIRLPANETKNCTVLHELRYYAQYTIEVSACQAPDVNGSRLCSRFAIHSVTTKKNPTADALLQRPSISNNTSNGIVTLNWVDPPEPNGGTVLSYVIYTLRMDDGRTREPNMVRKCDLNKCKNPPCEQRHEVELVPGNNSIRVRAYTVAGLGPFSQPVFWVVQAPDGDLTVQTIVGIVLGLMFVLLVSSVAVFLFYKRFAKQSIDNIYTSWNPYYGGQVSYQPDDWEVDIEKVHFEHVIGKGSFGNVYEGTALLRMSRDDPDDVEQLCKVAIKTVLEDASMYDRQAFLSEASLMKEFNCYHVVRLMGIVSHVTTESSENIPRPPFVIMELMTRGDLKSYLRSMRPEDDGVSMPEHSPVLPHIYQMAIQIADGMAYLTQMNSVHRDLAARNCMVTENITIKIGDFGMTRNLYGKDYYRKDGKGLLPVRWMGPESLRDGVFTSQSDVWSFGVVLWEMCTYAAQPYQGLSNEEVMQHVRSRNRLLRPENCPERLYALMYRCWGYHPEERPTFLQLVEELLEFNVGEEFAKHSFYHTQWPLMLAEQRAREEPEPTARTPLVEAPPTLQRRPRIAESEDLSDEDCEMKVRPRPARQPRSLADPEAANYAEFEEIKRNGGHGSLSSAENSKAHSLQFSSSDGSKGSKASNGSARNGYIAAGDLSHMRTAEC